MISSELRDAYSLLLTLATSCLLLNGETLVLEKQKGYIILRVTDSLRTDRNI